MKKKHYRAFFIFPVIMCLMLTGLQAQMFDVDVADLQSAEMKQQKQLPEDPFNDPENVQRFLEQFYRSHDRIVGGEDVDIKDYPWQVSMQLQPQFGGAHFCGGTIVDEEWVITASHCLVFEQNGDDFYLQPMHVRVRAGFTSMSSNEGAYYNAAEIIMHPDYDPDAHQFDIALVRISEPFDLEDENKAMVGRVTQADADMGLTEPGEMVKISGWGALSFGGPSPDILQAIEVPIVHVSNTNYPPSWITSDMIIAGAPGMDSCQGDSGGPMVVPDGNGWYKLAGVTSFGVGCGQAGYPGVYARVSFFEQWLDEHLMMPDPNQYSVMHHETFGDGDIPQGWDNVVIEGPTGFPGWEWTTTGGAYGGQLNSTTADDGYLILNSDAHGSSGNSEEVDLISEAFDFTGIENDIVFSVEHWARTYGNADIRIYISNDDFNTQTELYRWYDAPQNDFNGSNPVLSQFNITDIAHGQGNVKIKFKWIGEWDYWWLVDDFMFLIENDPLQVEFQVTDGQNPLAGVHIATPYTDQETTTDGSGVAHLTLYEGSYDISATLAGYFPYAATVDVTHDGQVVSIEMDKIPAPEIVIDTDEINLTIPQGTTQNVTVNIANPGDAELEYALFAYPATGKGSAVENQGETALYPGHEIAEPRLLGAERAAGPAPAGMETMSVPRYDETVEIHHDNGYGNNGIGTGGAASFITAARFTPEDLAPYYGLYNLGEVKYHIRSAQFSEVHIKIWEGGSLDGPGTEIYSAEVTDDVLIDQWSVHILPETIQLNPGQEYWMGYAIEATAGHPASVDFGPMVEDKGGWMFFNNSWSQLTEINPVLDYNWNIRGVLYMSETIDWLSFSPQSGTVAPEGNVDVQFQFDATDLDLGDFQAQVMVQNNAGESISIPVHLTVDPAEYDITFHVIDENGDAITDAVVTLGEQTNAAGDYTFIDVPVGTYEYQVSKTGYHTAEGHIMVVDQDMVVEVMLVDEDTDLVSLEVNIQDEFSGAVEGAVLIIEGFGSQVSDGGGQITMQIIPGTYDYLVTKTGFEPVADQVTISTDPNQVLNITLTYLRFDIVVEINLEEAGSVDGGGEYHWGQEATVTAQANTGYHFLGWMEGGMEVSTDEEYSFIVTSDRELTGMFQINTYIITATSDGNGSIDPEGELEVVHGEDITFDMIPMPGNYIEDVQVNGESIGVVDTYTFESVSADATIHVDFAIHTYEVTITSEGNGDVDPDGVVTVNHGSNLLIEFMPHQDHHVADVLINGHSMGAMDSYMLSNILANTTVHAIFEFSVGIDEVDGLPALNVFPNPASHQVTIQGGERMNEIRLYNMSGHLMQSVQAGGREYKLDISDLASGLYLIQVGFDQGQRTISLQVR